MSKVGLPEPGFAELAFGSPVLTAADRKALLKLNTIIQRELQTDYTRPESGTLTVTATQFGFNFQVTWAPVPGAKRYQVYRGTTSTFSASTTQLIATIEEQLDPGNRTYTDVSNQYAAGSVPTLYYWVRAVDEFDEGPVAAASVTNSGVDVVLDQATVEDLTVNGQITAALVESFNATDLVIQTHLDGGTGNQLLVTWANGVVGSAETLTIASAGGTMVIFSRTTFTAQAGAVLNEGGGDNDIRMESDANANHFYSDAGTFSGVGSFGFGTTAASTAHVQFNHPALSAPANNNYSRVFAGDTNAVTIPSGTAPIVANVWVTEPNITATGTVSNATSLYVQSAPTEGSNNYAIWVDSGDCQFDGNVNVAGTMGAASVQAGDGASGSFFASSDGVNLDLTITVTNGIITSIA